MHKVNFDKISILQSIPDNELHTGEKIKEDMEVLNSSYKRGLEIELFNIDKKDVFFEIIRNLTDKAKYDKSYPVLQIDAHGSADKQGIVLLSNEFISWADIKPYLIELNIATEMNLLIIFSLCNGAYFTSQLKPTDRAPCWGLIGPTRALAANELLVDLSKFYQEFFKSVYFINAIEKLNDSSPSGEINYYFTDAVTFFARFIITIFKSSAQMRNILKEHRRCRIN